VVAGPGAESGRQPPVPAARKKPAGQPAIIDIAGEVPVDPRQPRRVQPGLGRGHLLLEPAHRTPSPATGRPRGRALAPSLTPDSVRGVCPRSSPAAPGP